MCAIAGRSGLWSLLAAPVVLAGCSADGPNSVVTTNPDADADTVEWLTNGGDLAQTRYSRASQITAGNFADLETAWVWDGASFDAASGRSTPTFMNGKLITVAGPRRHVVAIDPATGETIWSYTEPTTGRYEYSMRKDYGKGVAYAEIDGKGVVYITSPASVTLTILTTAFRSRSAISPRRRRRSSSMASSSSAIRRNRVTTSRGSKMCRETSWPMTP
jgi:glucose dehydrogenase